MSISPNPVSYSVLVVIPSPIQVASSHQSRNVNKCVCKTFMARVASLASITHDMLISLAPRASKI